MHSRETYWKDFGVSETRIFSGKTYKHQTVFPTEREAIASATRLRASGYFVRVVKIKNAPTHYKYATYVRWNKLPGRK